MSTFLFRALAVCCLTMLLWVVPSVGTQGQGSRAQRFVHVDGAVMGQRADANAALAVADRVVVDALRAS